MDGEEVGRGSAGKNMDNLIKNIIDHSMFRCGSNGNQKCPPDWRIDRRLITDFDLWFVRSGRGTLRCDAGVFTVGPKELYLFRPGYCVSAEQDPDNPLHVYYCHFDAVNNPLFRFLTIPTITRDDQGRIAGAFELFQKEAQRSLGITNFSIRLLLYSIFQIWLEGKNISLDRHEVNPRRADTLMKAIDYLSLHLNQKVDLDELSRLCSLEKSGLSRLFKEYTGASPIRYHTNLRMQHAALLLEAGGSVKATASEIGYTDAFAFSKAFKKHMGLSPSDFVQRPEPDRVI